MKKKAKIAWIALLCLVLAACGNASDQEEQQILESISPTVTVSDNAGEEPTVAPTVGTEDVEEPTPTESEQEEPEATDAAPVPTEAEPADPTMTEAPAATAEPTATVVPTAAPTATAAPTTAAEPTAATAPTTAAEPTATIAPTATAEPTATAAPTATAVPTATPVPTATVAPTATPMPEPEGTNVLVAYFSWSGNTEELAEMIQAQTDGDLFEIRPATAYTEDYDTLLDVAQQELRNNARPAVAEEVENWEEYDVIFVGYPNWWSDAPRIVLSFLESYDCEGKTIVPFCTSGSGGFGRSRASIESSVPGAEMAEGLHVVGSRVGSAADTVANWINGLDQYLHLGE